MQKNGKEDVHKDKEKIQIVLEKSEDHNELY